jgi:ADP-ribosylglycohydrolase
VLWSAARSLNNFEDALWETVNGGGDIDTNCAIVGGIVAMRTGSEAIPAEWLRRREPLGPLLQAAMRKY